MKEPKYGWKINAFGMDAQTAGERLMEIREKNKDKLKPEFVLEDATSEDSPLHNSFEWDDKKAAHQHRLKIAQKMLQFLVIIEFGDEKLEPPIRAVLSIEKNNERYYQTSAKVLTDMELRQQILEEGDRELIAWKIKYSQYEEFHKIFEAIGDTALQFPQSEEKEKVLEPEEVD